MKLVTAVRNLLVLFGAISLAGARTSAAQEILGTPTQKLRVAVMDLSGSALKMQSTTTIMPGGQPQPGYPQQGVTKQTTVSMEIPPPAEFARGLTEALTTVLVKT